MSEITLRLHETDKAKSTNPEEYILSEDLKNAVEVAIALGQPLLLTGEPGTGKTQLAYKLAWLLNRQTGGNYSSTPLEFHTKTTSAATDLFYQYDAIKHFYDANIRKASGDKAPEASDYIMLQALGKAIALTNEKFLTSGQTLLKDIKTPSSSVVLIDEIDKAPRDFPNDILHEIESYRFIIKETGQKISKEKGAHTILVIMTSNSEKNLPEAFLRRCVFYHIPFPDKTQLLKIVGGRMESLLKTHPTGVENAIDYFLQIRERVKKKQPATAEMLAWLRILEINDFFKLELDFNNLDETGKKILNFSLNVLIKNKEDLQLIA